MTEEEMQKRLYDALEQKDFSQLRFPFILDRSEEGVSTTTHLMPDVKTDQKAFFQKDFLTHKVNQTMD